MYAAAGASLTTLLVNLEAMSQIVFSMTPESGVQQLAI
jgi:hypothetical protein